MPTNVSPSITARTEPAGQPGRARVLWLIKGLGAGGAEHLLALHARLRDRERIDAEVAYVLPWKQALVGAFEDAGVPVRCLGARSTADPRWLGRLRRLLATGGFDIVHSHSPVTNIGTRVASRTLSRRRRPRLVTTEHNVWPSHARLTRLADRLTPLPGERHLAVSEAVRDSMPPRLRAATEVVRYGIDVRSVQRAAQRRREVRESLGLADGEIVVGTVANLRANKAYPDLLAAASAVVAATPDVTFLAVGQGPLEQELRALHATLGLGDRFRFLGYREDAVAVMAAFDVFCLASRFEGLPVALMEALALGLPVVATDVGGVAELCRPGREALLVPAGRPDRLASELVVLARDPARRRELGASARTRAAVLDVGVALRRTEDVYLEMLGR
ncbi:MAG: hypothetical protein KatS3mg010_0581 [Acidimicrobiia bacterium]|nr:MAG: hypothetical protein KatS3mg010_0581 [Acidimicrobiia bacterium]